MSQRGGGFYSRTVRKGRDIGKLNCEAAAHPADCQCRTCRRLSRKSSQPKETKGLAP